MRYISRLQALVVAAALLACSSVLAESLNAKNIRPSGLTADQAKQVLLVVLRHQHYKMSNPDMWIDGPWQGEEKGTLFRAGYYDFGLVFNNPKGAASNVLGHFAVNILTGDVWETESCERFSSATLSGIQKRISVQTGKKLANEEVARSEIGCE
ncbi:hypothetical protein LOY38_17275 [Pseudomonas sp. B21-015]|uniref:hypothetical protein n=1 Tax=Pseudomonas sp. B21-015 TaxID=2895473 RepID=UPI00215E5D51|nr:hypothetical protein [Pseudomonas sp. B21-015]UVM53383.1 hypothetical protein LOY38_17275 [Pseudomonas sp. B21-015]